MADVKTIAGLVDSHTEARAQIRWGFWMRVLGLLLGLAPEDFFRKSNVVARELVDIAREARQAEADLTWETLESQLAELAPGADPTPAPDDTWDDLLEDFRGIPDEDVWDRPLEQYRYRLTEDGDEGAALDAAIDRAITLVEEDLSRTMRRVVTEHATRAPAVVGYRRVIHPEKSQGGTCGLCIVASTRLYSTDELMPIHTRCKCDVVEVTADEDLAEVLNQDDLAQLYQDAGGNTAEALKKTRYRVEEHSETGPRLVPPPGEKAPRAATGQNHDAPDDSERRAKLAALEAEIAVREATAETLWDEHRLRILTDRADTLRQQLGMTDKPDTRAPITDAQKAESRARREALRDELTALGADRTRDQQQHLDFLNRVLGAR